MDKLVSMRVFVNTVKLGSMAKAANELNVSPPMISKTISKLEETLGVQLIVRTTRKSFLTEAGQTYYDRCEKILEDIDETHNSLLDQEKAGVGTIRINAPVSFAQHVLCDAVNKFQEANNGIRFCIKCNDEKVDLVDSAYDLSIRITRELEDSSIRARRISSTQLKLCASPDYLKSNGTPSSLCQLASHNCIAYSYYDNGTERWSATINGEEQCVPISGDLVVNNGDVAINLATAGKGIILQPDFIVDSHLESGALVEVLPEAIWPSLNVYVIYPNAKHLPSKVRRFINFIAEELDDLGWQAPASIIRSANIA